MNTTVISLSWGNSLKMREAEMARICRSWYQKNEARQGTSYKNMHGVSLESFIDY